jgi:hypothetical protein
MATVDVNVAEQSLPPIVGAYTAALIYEKVLRKLMTPARSEPPATSGNLRDESFRS